MNNILSEKEYQKYILKNLAASGYEVQPADHYDRLFAVSHQELMRFLETTQPDEIESLKKKDRRSNSVGYQCGRDKETRQQT